MVSSGISGNIISVRTAEAVAGTGARKTDSDFGLIMTQSLAGNAGQTEMQFETSETKKPQLSTETVSQSAGNAQKDRIQRKTDSKEAEKVSGKKVKDELKDNPKLKKAVDKIRDKIKDEFGVSDEDIENALEVLGLTMVDLLQPGNLTDFVVELTGMESSVELLVSSEISTQLDELMGFINETMENLAEEFGISQEELLEVVQNMEVERSETEEVLLDEEGMGHGNANVQELPENVEIVKVSNDTERKVPVNETIENAEFENTGLENAKTQKITRPESKEFSSDENKDMLKDNHTKDMANGIVNNLTNVVNEAFEVSGLNEVVDSVRIIEQIVETAKVTLNQEVTSMELMLNPENLGKVNLTVSVKAGVVTASLVAQNEVVREAIEKQIITLKENLANQGIKVEAVEVTVESHAFEAGTQNGQNNAFNEQQEEHKKSSRPLRVDSLNELVMEDLTDEEKIVLDMMEEEGNQVNFTA